MKKLFLVLCFILISDIAYSNGMFVVEQGGIGNGKSGNVVASIQDGSALFYNPAGLTYVNTYNFEATGAIFFPSLTYSSDTGGKYEGSKKVLVNPSMFFTLPVGNRMTFAIGMTTPVLQNNSWKNNFPGRFLNSKYKIMSNALNFGFGLKLSDWLRVGASFNYTSTDLTLSNNIVSPYYDLNNNNELIGPMEIGTSANGRSEDFGYTIGLMVKPVSKINIGFTYKSEIDFNFESIKTDFIQITEKDIPNAVQSFENMYNYNYYMSTVFSTPEIYAVGLSYSPSSRWIIEADYSKYFFSRLDRQIFNYHKDENDVSNAPVFTKELISPTRDDMTLFGLSLEYVATKEIRIFGGMKFGNSVINAEDVTPTFIDADMFWISVGVSYLHKGNGFELSFFSKNFKDQKVSNQEMQININNPDTGYIEPISNTGLYDLSSIGISITYKTRF